MQSTASTGEQAIGGVTAGLIAAGEDVEWKARHFGLWLKMRVRITGFQPPGYFQDSMTEGPFDSFTHDHIFKADGSSTWMMDRIVFRSPVPLLDGIIDRYILRNHLQRLLQNRNQQLKAAAESDEWRRYLHQQGG